MTDFFTPDTNKWLVDLLQGGGALVVAAAFVRLVADLFRGGHA